MDDVRPGPHPHVSTLDPAGGGVAVIPHPAAHRADPPVQDRAGGARQPSALDSNDTRALDASPARPFRLRRLGETDLRLFPVALGTAHLASTGAMGVAVLDAYRSAGGNVVVTTGEDDPRGDAMVARWLAERGRRDRVVVMTRVGGGGAPLSSAAVTRAVRASKERLGLQRIDAVLLPDDRGTPLEETLTAMDAFVRTGEVGALIADGYSAMRLIEARIVAAQRGLAVFSGVHTRYSLLERQGYESAAAPAVAAQGLGVMTASPLAGGLLATTASAARRIRGADSRADRRAHRIREAVTAVAVEREVPPAAVALAWLLTRPQVVAPAVDIRSVAELPALIAATALRLSHAETTALDRVSAG